MRHSNKFYLDQTMAGLYANRDPDVMAVVRKSVAYRHKDLHLDPHTPHMKYIRHQLRPRESQRYFIKKMEELY